MSRRLAHEGWVAVQDVGEVDGEPYLAEEFFEGHDLAEMSKRCVTETRRISVISALHIACAISRALGFLHEFEDWAWCIASCSQPGCCWATRAG